MTLQSQPTEQTPRRQVIVRSWVCRSCGQTGPILPAIDLEGSEYRVADMATEVMHEHFLNGEKGTRCRAFIVLQA